MSFRPGRKTTITIGAAIDTIVSENIPSADGGLLIEVKIVIPTCTNVVTFTFSILDRDGDERYSIALLARATKPIILPNRYVEKGYKYGITSSGVTGTIIAVGIYPTYEV